VSEHISNQRLAKIAGENSRLSETELAHLSGCSDCLAAYGRSILQVARATAKEKVRFPSAKPVGDEFPMSPIAIGNRGNSCAESERNLSRPIESLPPMIAR
jgi:hypothetical protein